MGAAAPSTGYIPSVTHPSGLNRSANRVALETQPVEFVEVSAQVSQTRSVLVEVGRHRVELRADFEEALRIHFYVEEYA